MDGIKKPRMAIPIKGESLPSNYCSKVNNGERSRGRGGSRVPFDGASVPPEFYSDETKHTRLCMHTVHCTRGVIISVTLLQSNQHSY